MLRGGGLFGFTVTLMLAAASLSVSAADKPIVFNHISGQRTETDRALDEHFESMYSIVDFTDQDHSYVYPRPIAPLGSTEPQYIDKRCVSDSVFVAYVITTEGTIASAYAFKFTHPALAKVAVQRMTQARFQPASLDGKVVSTLAASRFSFRCPVDLKAVVGLWKFENRAVWINISDDGSAFQCRIDRDGTVLAARGRFSPPDGIAWDKYWNTETLEYAEGTLTIEGTTTYGDRSESFSPVRSTAPMAPACVIAERGGS
jgi:hypothetical protein